MNESVWRIPPGGKLAGVDMYARHRNDNNKAEIVKALRDAGCFVSDLSQAGNGVPDILVCRAERWYPIEIKSSRDEPLTEAEVKWWYKADCIPAIASSPEAALEIVGL